MKLEGKNLEARLGGSTILKGVSLCAEGRELVGVIGPNGSGKSTLLKCLYRVLRPSGGAVWLDGQELGEMPRKQSARSMAVVAQHNDLSFEFTVQEMVLMGRSPHKRLLERDSGADLTIAAQALAQVGLENLAQRPFSSLSGGERQRVILARALAQQAPVLILDEPTNHLDIKFQLQLMDLLRGLPCTVVAALHDLNLAAMYCDRLYVMKDGRVAGQGRPEEVLTPQLIRQVYEVEARVEKDRTGGIQIFYCANRNREIEI